MALAQAPAQPAAPTFGELLRTWRKRRRHSQLQLALAAQVSARHLGFIETGRARPSRELVLHLAHHLDIPLRERNTLLLAAGFAPVYTEQPLDAPEMEAVRTAVELVLNGHQPYPALAVDRCWNAIAANPAAAVLSAGVAEHLLGPPVNVYRVSLHPDGMARQALNFDEYAPHLVSQLRHDLARTGDPRLAALLDEVEAYPTVQALRRPSPTCRSVVVPLRLRHPTGELSLFTTIATFGTPADVTVSELAIESFFPADPQTAALLHQLAATPETTGTAESDASRGVTPR
jgi:transcriptional regulator with XRE-family HTH domain